MKKITLINAEGKKVRKNKGFSVKFLIFGSLNYLFSGRFVKTLFAWIWYALTLIWLFPIDKVNDVIIKVADKIADLLVKIKLEKVSLDFLELINKFVDKVNVKLFGIEKPFVYDLSKIAAVGLGLFLLIRIFKALRYNKRVIKRLKKAGYKVIEENVPVNNNYDSQPNIQINNYGNIPPQANPAYSYEKNQTAAAVRASQSKRAVELHLLNEAYAAGLVSHDVYMAKKAILENN